MFKLSSPVVAVGTVTLIVIVSGGGDVTVVGVVIAAAVVLLILIYLLTAIGLTPGGSSTVHIYTQTMHRTTQLTT